MTPSDHCKYHQQTPARWYCSNCHINFCDSCVNDLENDDPPNCALCRSYLDDNGLEAFIPPFWQRIPLFFKIPLDKNVAMLIIGIILAAYLLPYIPVLGSLMALIVLPIVFVKYAYLLLEEVASGELHTPRLSLLVDQAEYSIVFKQVFILFVLFFPIASLAQISLFLMYCYYFLVMLLIPATVMVLAIEKSFLAALNPFLLFSFIRRIGFSYIGLYLLIMVINGGPSIILEFLIGAFYGDNFEPTDIFVLFAFFAVLQMYFSLVIFTIMGYLLLKYHHRLGYRIDANIENFIGGYKRPPIIEPLLKDVEVLIREKQHQQALQVLRTRVMEHLDNINLRKRYHKLLLLNRETERLLNHGDDLINTMLAGPNPGDAIIIYQDCKNMDKKFHPKKIDNYLPLAEIMLRLGQYKWMVLLIKGVHLRFPDDSRVPKLYFLMARALSDGFKEDEKAKQVLQFILKNYSEPGNKKEIMELLGILNKVQSEIAGSSAQIKA